MEQIIAELRKLTAIAAEFPSVQATQKIRKRLYDLDVETMAHLKVMGELKKQLDFTSLRGDQLQMRVYLAETSIHALALKVAKLTRKKTAPVKKAAPKRKIKKGPIKRAFQRAVGKVQRQKHSTSGGYGR